jgi:hypothetical protein
MLMEINYFVTVCEQHAFWNSILWQVPTTWALWLFTKKIQPIPNSRRCWDQPFSIAKVSSKSKTKNLKCQNEVILGDCNHHNSDIYVLNFYVWFEWVAPKNFNPMDNQSSQISKRTTASVSVLGQQCFTWYTRKSYGFWEFIGLI